MTGQRRDRGYYARRALVFLRASIGAAAARPGLAAWRPDVVYVNTVHALPLVARMGLGGVPAILHVHELTVALASFEAAHPGLIARIPDRFIAVSAAVKDELASRYRIERGRIAIVRPFVDLVAHAEQPANVSVGDRPFVVGGVGNPSWFKGIPLWLLAARQVADQLGNDHVHFVWLGIRDNEEGRYVRAMAEKLRLDSVVDFVPETADAAQQIAGFDILAVSSWEESASMAVLEAMASGVPVVAYAGSGGPAEEIGEAGELLADFSPGALADAIIELARRPARRAELTLAGFARIEATFNPESLIAQILAEITAASMTRDRGATSRAPRSRSA